MYDQYQIVAVDVMIVPTVTMGTPTSPADGWMTVTVDYDDVSTPTSLSELYQYDQAAQFSATENIRMTVRPRAALAAYSGAFTSYANLGNMWIDCGSSSVQHYGLKLGLPATSVAKSWYIFNEYTLAFRSGR